MNARSNAHIAAITVLGLSSLGLPARAEDDAEQLQGKWRVVSAEQNGADFRKEQLQNVFVVFADDEVRVYRKGTKAEQAAKFTLEAEKKQIDFTKETRDSEWANNLTFRLFRRYKWEGGQPVEAEGPAQGIYKLEGDSLTICWRTTEAKEIRDGKVASELQVRPTVFRSDLYYQQFLFVLERVKE